MKNLINENRSFFIGYFLILILALLLKLAFTKEQLFLAVNLHHHPVLDYFFYGMTYIGDGVFFILVLVFLLLVVRTGFAVYGLIIYLVTSQIAQVLKRVFFLGVPRPKRYFEGISQLHFVDGVQVHSMMSFPSGHTTSVFALATFLSLIARDKRWSIVYLGGAVLVAYSRMYLAQHFFEDVLMGSVIGVVVALVCYAWLEKSRWTKKTWMNRSLLNK